MCDGVCVRSLKRRMFDNSRVTKCKRARASQKAYHITSSLSRAVGLTHQYKYGGAKMSYEKQLKCAVCDTWIIRDEDVRKNSYAVVKSWILLKFLKCSLNKDFEPEDQVVFEVSLCSSECQAKYANCVSGCNVPM